MDKLLSKRKTIQVTNVREAINNSLEWEKSRDAKRALCSLLEDILMVTDNYRGFRWNMTTPEAKAVQPGDDTYYNRIYF